jgi:hypothetical protein
MASRKKAINGNGKSSTQIEEMVMIATPETPSNINQAFEVILDTQPEMTLTEAATYCNCGDNLMVLQSWLSERLPEEPVFMWQTIPSEHAPLLDEFKRVWEAQQTIRKLTSDSTAQPFRMPVEAPEIPLIEDKPIPPQSQQESSAIAPTEPRQLAQGHAEQLQERLNLENYAREAEQGVRELAIETALQKADNLSEDIKNAFRQRLAQNKGLIWEEIAEELIEEYLAETNSQLAKPTAFAEIQKRNEARQPAFLSKLKIAKEAFKNRNIPSQPAS